MPPNDSADGARRLDSVRQALRQRGYLRTPVDRFLFGGRRPFRSKLGALAAAALRVALVGAPIVAALFVLFLIQHNAPHLYRHRDLAFLYLYALPLAALLLGSATLAGGLLVGIPDRPRRGIGILPPEPLGFAVAALFGLYIGWRWLSVPARGDPPLAISRLLLAVLLLSIGVWLGSVVSRALRGHMLHLPGPPVLPPSGSRRWRNRAWSILPVATIISLLFLYPPVPPPEPAPDLVPIGTAAVDRMVVVAIDGLDWLSLPEVWPGREKAIPLRRAEAGEPPAIWTTLVTGYPAEQHGVHSVQTLWMAGVEAPLRQVALPGPLRETLHLILPGITPLRRRPVNATQRRRQAIWEIFAAHGRRPAAVNWWATWPVPRSGAGVVVSERTFFKLLAGGDADRETRPAGLYESLQARFGERQPVRREDLFPNGTEFSLDEFTAHILLQAMAADRFHLELAVDLLDGRSIDDLFLYLPGLDIVQVQLFGAGQEGTLPELRHRVEVVEVYFRFLAQSIGTLAARLEKRDLLVLIGDPGRLRPPRAGTAVNPGVLALQGGEVRLDPSSLSGDGFDLTPTLLHLRGFPRAVDMPGRSLLDEVAAAPPPISSYGSPANDHAGAWESPFDEELLEQLRGLGYLD